MVRIGLLTLVLCLAAAAGLLARRIWLDRTPPPGTATYFVGGQKLAIPRAMVRDVARRDGGAFERLDLALKWPNFEGAAAAQPGETARGLVFIGLEDAHPRAAATGDINPADLPSELYARFLAQEAWSNPGGLVMRRFRAGTPYEGEELYVSTPDERLFAARCHGQSQQAAIAEDLCLWQTRKGGLDLQVRFSPRLLTDWQVLVNGVGALVPRLRQGG